MQQTAATMTTRLRGALSLRGLPLLLVVAAPLVLVACGDEQPTALSGQPSITGVVKTASAGASGEVIVSFLVVEGAGDYNKASVASTGDTAWYRSSGDKVESVDAPAADALIGERVEVQFAGPVAESCPVQATAGWIVVHD